MHGPQPVDRDVLEDRPAERARLQLEVGHVDTGDRGTRVSLRRAGHRAAVEGDPLHAEVVEVGTRLEPVVAEHRADRLPA